MSLFHPIRDAIQRFAESEVDDAIDEERNVEAWFRLMADINAAREMLRHASGHVEELIIDCISDSGYPLPEGGTLMVKHSPRSPKWDGPAIVARLTAMALDERKIDRETGEALESEGAAVARVFCDAAPLLTPSFGWRRGVLKKRLGDLDELVSVEGWSHRLVLE